MRARHLAVVLVLALAAHAVRAQPAAAIGKPLPSADLPIGTVSVRVIDGTVVAPLAGVVVWLSVDGIAKTATTDAAGRAVFAGLAVGATVIAAIDENHKSDSFVVPDAIGTRVLLSKRPLAPGPGAPPMPSARDISGQPRPDERLAVGALDVRLTYDDLADPRPPAQVPVTLVGYRADGSVALTRQATDREGSAHFTGLDHSGAVAYFALATLPRAGAADRLVAAPVVPDDTEGTRIVMSAERRTAKLAPVDELAPTAPIGKGKLRVRIDGLSEPGSPLRVVDAATGKEIASGSVDKEATLELRSATGAIYVEAVVRGERYRSRPFQPVADRGAEVTVFVYPRLIVQFSMIAEPVGSTVVTWAQFSLQNNAWIPYAGPVAIPLPAGFAKAELAADDRARAALTAIGLEIARPLAPGEQRVRVRFALAAGRDGAVHWDQDLPFGALQSGFRIADEPGVAITGIAASPVTFEGERDLAISEITILPHKHLAMAIALPKLTPKQDAVARACEPLAPDRKTALRGMPMPDFTAPQLDGEPLRLASLKGKVIVVNFMASWVGLSAQEQPTFAPLASALGKDLAIVLVASDDSPADVKAKVGASPPFRVVLDPSAQPVDRVGPITASWGVHLLPESFVVDRHGIVRLYLSNSRDWSTPEARACVEAIAKD